MAMKEEQKKKLWDAYKKNKTPEIHACQACWDANKMTNAWNKATCNGGYLTVVIKVFLAFFYFFLI